MVLSYTDCESPGVWSNLRDGIHEHTEGQAADILQVRGEQECARDYQNSTIWPFAHNWAVVALAKAGRLREAREELGKMDRLKGFNEFYYPDGRPGGSKNQLWSAATYIWAKCALGES